MIELGSDAGFLLLCSDGVWEFVSSQEAVDFAASFQTPLLATEQLAKLSWQRWRAHDLQTVDDITAMTTSLVTTGLDVPTATTIAKAVARNSFTQTLMKAELGYDTRVSFNTDMGIS